MQRSMIKKAQSFSEYSALILIIIGGLLIMYSYLKRSLQGRIQMQVEQQTGPYHYGSTKLNEYSSQIIRTVNWALPGPRNIIKTETKENFRSSRELKSKL